MKVYDGAMLLGTVAANGSGAWSYTTAALADGTHSLTATATDAAGNTSAASAALSVTVDTAAPGAPRSARSRPTPAWWATASPADNTLTLTGTAEASSTVKVYDGATLLGTVTADGSGAWSYTTAHPGERHAQPDGNGDRCCRQRQRGLGGLTVTVDTAAPSAPAIASFSNDSGTVGDGITNDNTLTLTGTAEANSTVKVYDGATLLGSATADGSGAWSYTTGGLANGTHSLTATATDAAGNTGAASAALSVTVDAAAPGAPAIASFSTDSGTVGDGITNDNTLTLTGTAEANSTVKVYDGATLLGQTTADGSGAWSYTTAVLANGTHSLTATATDAAGNTSAASAALKRDGRHGGAGRAGDRLVLDRQRHGRRRHHQRQHADADRHGRGQQHGEGVRRGDAARHRRRPMAAAPGATPPAVLANGSHSLTATATDAAGNTSAASAALERDGRHGGAGRAGDQLRSRPTAARSATASPTTTRSR